MCRSNRFMNHFSSIRGDSEKNKNWVPEGGDSMTRSCNNCALFAVNTNQPLEYSGYCLFFMLEDVNNKDSQKKIKITAGKEIEVAENCENYFDLDNFQVGR